MPALTICTSVARLCCAKAVLPGARLRAEAQRLLPKTMPVVEEQHDLVFQHIGRRGPRVLDERMAQRCREDEWVSRDDLVVEIADVRFEREQDAVEVGRP